MGKNQVCKGGTVKINVNALIVNLLKGGSISILIAAIVAMIKRTVLWIQKFGNPKEVTA